MSVQTPLRPPPPSTNGSGPNHHDRGASRDRLVLEARRAARPLLIYVLALAGALIAAAVILHDIHVTLPWSTSYQFRVAVDDAKGVSPGTDEVRIAGVPVGRVTAVDLVGGHAVLTATIDQRYAPLYRDARLALRPQTALDDMYLDIVDRGRRSAGELGGDRILSAERTQTPVDIGKVLDVFTPDTRAQMKRALDEMSVGLPDHGSDLRSAFAELAPFLGAAQRLTGQLAVRRAYVARLVHNFRLLTEALAERTQALITLIQAGNDAFGTVSHNATPFAAVIQQLPPMLSQLESSFTTLRGTLQVVDPALDAMRPVAAALPSGLQALQSFSQAALPAFTALGVSVQRLLPLAQALAPTSTSLSAAFAQLQPEAPRLDRVTSRIVPCKLAVQKFFQWTPSVFKFSDAHGAYPRGESVDASDAQLAKTPSCAGTGGG